MNLIILNIIFIVIANIGVATNGQTETLSVCDYSILSVVKNERIMRTKVCTKCGGDKPINKYRKRNDRKSGYRSSCIDCDKLKNKKWYRTKIGVIRSIYNGQKYSCKKRGHKPPQYTYNELEKYLLDNTLFNNLYDQWVSSGYHNRVKPSVDRLDDSKSYTFDNIQITTWDENRAKTHSAMRNGELTPNFGIRSVTQYDLQGNYICEYPSMMEAQRKTGVSNSKISMVCKGKRNKAGGYVWKYNHNPPRRGSFDDEIIQY